MFFSVAELVYIFNVKPSGVLHVGAHRGEEASEYQRFGWGNVVWVEAQPDLVRELIDRLPGRENYVIEAAVWDESGVELDFKIASNGESSRTWKSRRKLPAYKVYKFFNYVYEATRRNNPSDSIC